MRYYTNVNNTIELISTNHSMRSNGFHAFSNRFFVKKVDFDAKMEAFDSIYAKVERDLEQAADIILSSTLGICEKLSQKKKTESRQLEGIKVISDANKVSRYQETLGRLHEEWDSMFQDSTAESEDNASSDTSAGSFVLNQLLVSDAVVPAN